MNNALAAPKTAVRQEPKDLYAAASKLTAIIEDADVEEFISVIEKLDDQTDPWVIFNSQVSSRGSLLHIAAERRQDNILRLLLDHVADHRIASKNDWGDTPLHMAAKAGACGAAGMLIRQAKDKNQILRMKNKRGNTALHEAVLIRNVEMACLLWKEDSEPMYLENAERKSPLYLALDTGNSEILQELFSSSLEPSSIQGLSPVHGAVVRGQYDLLSKIHAMNMKLFAMTDSGGGNLFHFAAHTNRIQVFKLLEQGAEYLANDRDNKGDLPIHIASKMGHVHLIEKLLPVSGLLNRQGQTILHVAAKYGRSSAVKYMLKHPNLGKLINKRDHDGNTPSHLAAMHSHPATLILLVLDERRDQFCLNHELLTALDIALDGIKRDCTLRKVLAVMVLGSEPYVSKDLLVLRPEARDEAFIELGKKKPNRDHVKDVNNTHLLVATLVATVTFAAGFAVPGGFNSSDMASEDDRGMATMLDNRKFQAFTICNTIAMLCSMTAVVNLMWAQQKDVNVAIAANQQTKLLLKIAFPAMFAAFLTGVTLTVGKHPWLANTMFYLGIIFLLIFSGAKLLEYPPFFKSHHRPIRFLKHWLVLAHIVLWGVETNILDDMEEDSVTVTRFRD
ncbi:protein ACCELERATED CELL DEATH 6 [Eucalyptus grandis]|uniref:protein ACCELERATED CELL DEATH 6 n=1 Tax=Eucalyptus grandis TaxID=71139 RepID=UPI00192ECC99|nr:protein ACCELERATED CELL DEATH 6 [Eucalyptus grandis]